MVVAYLLLTHGRKHFPSHLLREHPAARQQIANIEAWTRKLPLDQEIAWRWDYARRVQTLGDLPWLFNALTKWKESDGGIIVIDDLQRLFGHVPLEHRKDFLKEIWPFERHVAGLRQALKTLGELKLDHLKLIVYAPATRYVAAPTPRAFEMTDEAGSRQTRAATIVSRRVRSRQADAVANKLARLRAELLEERQSVSAAELAREANTRGLKTTRGRNWSRQSVSRALRRFAEKERHGAAEEAR